MLNDFENGTAYRARCGKESLMFFRLLRSVREYKRPAILTLILMVGEAGIETALPYITATYLINRIQEKGAELSLTGDILPVGLLMVGLALVSLICAGLGGFTCARASSGFAKNLRHDIFQKVQTFTFANIDKFSSSSLVTRMTTDVANVQMAFMMLIRTAVRSPLMLIFSVVMATVMGGWLALTFAVVIPLLALGFLLISRKAMPAFHRVFRKYDALNESIEENVRGMRVVKGFSREEYEKKKFAGAADAITEDFTKAERIVAFNTPLMNFCMYFNMVFILLIGSLLAIKHPETGINIGQISALLNYGMAVLMSLMMLAMVFLQSSRAFASGRRINEVMDTQVSLTDDHAAYPEAVVKNGKIEFQNVSFRYYKDSAEKVLDQINLTIEPGQMIGIIGSTGCGKTTLVSMIPRLYDVDGGKVLVDGIDVRDYSLNHLREGVGMVLQKNVLFSGTIEENLQWGDENADKDQIREAAESAQAEGFIQKLADGYDTELGQGGVNVSGGQKQRLCIARALLKRPKILILDDSTSAVDTATEARIREAFSTTLKETTKLIIAQRIGSVMEADQIIVMDGGKIVGLGKHEALLETCKAYQEIYDSQMKKEVIA